MFHRTTYRDDENRSVSDALVREVRLNNPTFSAADIQGEHNCTGVMANLLWRLVLIFFLSCYLYLLY